MGEFLKAEFYENTAAYREAMQEAHASFSELDFTKPDRQKEEKFLTDLKDIVERQYGMTEVPQSFIDENKGIIIFTPMGLHGAPSLYPTEYAGGRVEDSPEKAHLRESYFQEEFNTLPITNMEDLMRVLSWCDKELTLENEVLVSTMYFRAVATYLQNLELYRLTKEPSACLYRYAESDNEEDIPFEKRDRYGGWVLNSNELVSSLAQYRINTHWFRREHDPNETQSYLGKTHLRYSNIAAAKKDYLIALDPGEESALILIKK